MPVSYSDRYKSSQNVKIVVILGIISTGEKGDIMADEIKFGKRFKLCRILAGHDTLAEASEATGISKGAISS